MRRTAVLAVIAVALVASVCGDDDDSSSERSSSSTTTTSTTVAPTTTTAAPVTTVAPVTTAAPSGGTVPPGHPTCDGVAGVERDVRAQYQGLVANPSTDIVVSSVRLASTDARYGSANAGPSGPNVQIQGAYYILECPEVGGSGGNFWIPIAEGTSGVGCDLQIPPAVKQELQYDC